MSSVDTMILRDIEDDAGIKIKALGVEVYKKGFIPRKSYVRLTGIAHSAHDKDRVDQIAHHHCGDAFVVVDEIEVDEGK